ncbi:MAG: hypothetical protein AAF828_04690 [Bacteroidota bacterium]
MTTDQPIIHQQLLSFYGWWQFAVCLFAFIGLMGIWWHIGRRQKDVGQVWLALSVLCWSCSGLLEVYFSAGNNHHVLAGFRSIFSLFNSVFILLALPWFRYVPQVIAPLIKSRFWYLIVGLPFLFSLLPTLSGMVSGQRAGFISELDVYYAMFTIIFLGIVLWSSFARRRLPILAALSALCILITIVAQLYKFNEDSLAALLFSAIFKTALIVIFFALALSWVKELSEKITLRPEQFTLNLRIEKKANGQLSRFVEMSGFGTAENTTIPLTYSMYELLETFIDRRKNVPTEGWLEIKPKFQERNGKSYDINDHNQIKRLLQRMLNGLYGRDNWSKELHFIPLKEALFETSPEKDRMIRIRVY